MSPLTLPQAFELAVQYHQAGRFAEAEALYRQILGVEPRHADALHSLGIMAHQIGRNETAVELILKAIALLPTAAPFHCNLGLAYHRLGRFKEAITAYRRALELKPDSPIVHNNLGNALRDQGHVDEAVREYRRALELKPNYVDAHNNLGTALEEQGRFDEAVASYRRALELKPDFAEAHDNLGTVLKDQGHFDDAIAEYRRALKLKPDSPVAHNNLGNVLRDQGHVDEAIAAFHRALECKPDYVEAHNNLGNALHEQGRLDEAIAAYRRALELKPDHAEAHNNLAVIRAEQGHLEEAMSAYGRALKCKPDYVDAHNNLGNALKEQGRLDEAMAAYSRAIELKPDYAEAHNNAGNVLKDRGQLDEAIAAYRRAIQFEPQYVWAHSNLIHTLHFHPDLEQEAVAGEQRRWNRQFGDALEGAVVSHHHDRDRDPERRLRVGYVSPDFRDHAVAFFLTPLLEAHDHGQFEIYGYSTVSRPDAVTARLREGTDVWREARYLSDAQLAERIREDGVDILVDLAMHTAGNRLLAFARKPAPVQVSWLGYPGSTGVEAIGHRFSDGRIDPVEWEESGCGEQVARLPDAWCCYAPIAEFPPLGTLPAVRGRGMTFGSLNQFAKINEAVLGCWALVLLAVPDARLLMVCPAGQAQERTRRQFAERGVSPQRVELVAPLPWGRYLGLCQRIDVALDTYPCNGMTTTCHALWMGVPVITRAGQSAVSRASLSLLHTIGLRELVAQSEEEYVRIAVELAGDLKRLGELRATMRARMAASPLMDAPRFAGNMEAAYRTIWRQWCQGEKAR